MNCAVKEKKYTEDHEWIEMSADGKTCTSISLESPRIPATPTTCASFSQQHMFFCVIMLTESRVLTYCDTGTLGISKFAANQLGDIVFIELPKVDMEVSEGDAIGTVESVKSASDILTPIAGVVTEINEGLESSPEQVNRDPEGDAWIAKIEVSQQPSGKTMTEAEYAEFTKE